MQLVSVGLEAPARDRGRRAAAFPAAASLSGCPTCSMVQGGVRRVAALANLAVVRTDGSRRAFSRHRAARRTLSR